MNTALLATEGHFFVQGFYQLSQLSNDSPNNCCFHYRAYTTIVSKEQRIRYKAEFNQDYATYRKLHNKLDQVSKRFAHFESKLKQHQRGSEGFKVSKYHNTETEVG